ncbi:DUF5979 domain-containing protein [Comamonas testosteroni]
MKITHLLCVLMKAKSTVSAAFAICVALLWLAPTTSFAQSADLQLTKSGPSSATGGGTFTYTLVMDNNGPNASHGATFIDTLPAGVSNVAMSCVSASAGAQCPTNLSVNNTSVSGTLPVFPNQAKVTIEVTGNFPATGPTSLTNTATITVPAGVSDPKPDSNTSAVSTSMSYVVDLSVIKTQSPAAYTSGVPVTYTVTIANSGPAAADGARISDFLRSYATGNYTNLVATFVSCTAGGGAQCPANSAFSNYSGVGAYDNYLYSTTVPRLPANGSLTIVYTLLPTDTVAPCGTGNGDIQNFAFVSPPSGVTDSNSNNNASSVALLKPAAPACPQVDLSVIKTQSPATYTSGVPVTYTVTVSNAGPNAANGAMIRDFMRTYGSGNYTNLVASFVSCTAAGGAQCPANSAFQNYSGVGAYDNYLYSTTIPQFPAGGSLTIVYTMMPTDVAAPCGTGNGDIQNFAFITAPAGTTDSNSNNDASSVALLKPAAAACPQADLSVTKTQSPENYVSGAPVTYTITFNNAGPSAANGTSISDFLRGYGQGNATNLVASFVSCTPGGGAQCPANSAFHNYSGVGAYDNYLYSTTVPQLPSGGSLTIIYTLVATDIAAPCSSGAGDIQNFASITPPAGVTDPEGGNNNRSVALLLSCADVSVNKSVAPVTTVSGGTVTYTIDVASAGPADTSNVAFSDPLPVGFNYSSASCSTLTAPATCGPVNFDSGTRTVSSSIALIGSQGAVRFLITGTAGSTPGTYPNTAYAMVAPGVVDPIQSSNSSTVNLQIVPSSTLTVVKTVNGGPATGLPAAMTFTGVITCGAQAQQNWSVTVAAGATTGNATALRFIDGDTCSITENTPPTAPTGYIWSGAPSISPNPTTAIGPSAALTINVTNTLQATTSTLTVVKTVSGGPATGLPAAMTFTGVITCGAQAPQSWSVTVAAGATTGTATALRFIDGDTCSITENTPPTAPTGYTWSGAPRISPNPTTAIGPSAALTINVTNTLVQQDTGGNPGVLAPVPSLNQWALMLLSIVLVGFPGADVRRARKTR